MANRRMARPNTWALRRILAALLLLNPMAASAQTEPESVPTDDLEEAIRLSELGRLHYEGGDYTLAADAFTRAFELQPDPILGYNAARSHENAGEPERALELYQQTLAVGTEDEDLRRRLQDGVARIQNLLRRVEEERLRAPGRVSAESEPSGATLLIDGEAVGTLPTTVELEAGEYLVRLELSGYEPYEERITLPPAETIALRVTLEGDPRRCGHTPTTRGRPQLAGGRPHGRRWRFVRRLGHRDSGRGTAKARRRTNGRRSAR